MFRWRGNSDFRKRRVLCGKNQITEIVEPGSSGEGNGRYKIAVIEDDALLKQALMQMLLENGYEVFGAGSLLEARRMLQRYAMDLLLIDRWLPDGDGADLCRYTERREKVPVIFLTARDEEADIVEAFNLGADDYLVKPVALPVLLKHLEAVLRRTAGGTSEQFSYQDFLLDYGKKELRIGGRPVKLTPKEYRILEILTKNPYETMTKVKNAGAIFLGEYSSEPLGDYYAGPNHVLPTNGTAKFFSPLNVDDYVKKSSIISYSREALEKVHEDIELFAQKEGLTAHANSIHVRFDQ